MKPKKKNLKASRVKMKAPGSDQDDIDTKPAGEGKKWTGGKWIVWNGVFIMNYEIVHFTAIQFKDYEAEVSWIVTYSSIISSADVEPVRGDPPNYGATTKS